MLSFREREFFRRNNGGKAKFRKKQVLNSNPTLVVYYRLLGKSNTREKNFLLGYLFFLPRFFSFFFSFFFITLDKTSYFLLLRCVVPKVALAFWRSTQISSFYKTFKTLNSKFYYESKVDMILVENVGFYYFIFREYFSRKRKINKNEKEMSSKNHIISRETSFNLEFQN